MDLIQLLRAPQIAAIQIAEHFILHLFEDPYHEEFVSWQTDFNSISSRGDSLSRSNFISHLFTNSFSNSQFCGAEQYQHVALCVCVCVFRLYKKILGHFQTR